MGIRERSSPLQPHSSILFDHSNQIHLSGSDAKSFHLHYNHEIIQAFCIIFLQMKKLPLSLVMVVLGFVPTCISDPQISALSMILQLLFSLLCSKVRSMPFGLAVVQQLQTHALSTRLRLLPPSQIVLEERAKEKPPISILSIIFTKMEILTGSGGL